MNRKRLAAAVAAAPLCLGLFAACSSGGDDEGSDRASLQERLFAGNEADAAEQQQLIRECMREQGFDYTPVDTRNQALDSIPDSGSEEFAREFGFGVSTMFATAIDIVSVSDPNAEYRESLDENQQAAYDRALYGMDLGGGAFFGGNAIPIGGSDSGSGAQFSGPGGCVGEALEATGSGAGTFDASLFDDLQELEERIKADPRMVDAMKDWSTCMARAGHDYQTRDDAIGQIRDEFADLTGLEVSGDGAGFVFSAGSVQSENGETFDPLANVDKAKLADLQAREIALALASYTCSRERLAAVEEDVRAELEEEFLADHPSLGER